MKVGMLILLEHNLEDAVEFYKKLGLTLKFHLKQNWAEFRLNDIKFGLCPTNHEPFDRHSGIVLEVEDLKKTQEQLKQQGIEFLREIVEAPHGMMASIKDPSGNIMDLYQPTPEKIKEFVQKTTEEKK
jgi:predicted enzyme related to lactoylglutathione lyase